jgi:hypothetical protein
MKSAATVVLCTGLLLLAPGTARAQDPVKVDPAH